ncbi:MAG: APC family permease [Actinobacteria bacterium]|nr:MAG: APC family permease [Actinomycetota bacterium]
MPKASPGRSAVARLTEHGLRRSVGVPGMFATAYGNVGSSIYYALGLVAVYALGVTPLVFLLAGGLFVLTAKTYAEGAAMFPEAGGASSFARHAFNEVASFFAGWALTLDYIITIAISAFFVPHYLGAFFPGLLHNPGDIIGGIITLALLAVAGRAPAAAGAVRTVAHAVPHALVHDHLLLDPRRAADRAGGNHAARQSVRVRRDAVVHDRARGGDRVADQATGAGPAVQVAAQRAHPRLLGPAHGGDRWDRHVRRLVLGRGAAWRGAHDRDSVDARGDDRVLALSQAAGSGRAQAVPN